MTTRNERFLAVLIFVLWSLGVVIYPYLSNSGLLKQLSDTAQWYLLLGYLLVHAVIWVYVLTMLPMVWKNLRRRKKHAVFLAILYGYAFCMLSVSMYFIGLQVF